MADGKLSISLWLLERQDSPGPDESTKVVVAASTEKEARQIVNSASEAEGYIWTDGHLVRADRLGEAAEDIHGIICKEK